MAEFKETTRFVFICNEDHLNDRSLELQHTLEKYCPTGKIVSIPAHKQGPVYAVLQAKEYINPDKKIIAPSIWFGPRGPRNFKDIYEPYWTVLDVKYENGWLS